MAESQLTDATPAPRHRIVAGAFSRLVDGTRPEQWDDPTPVPEWRARDVVAHLVAWSAGFLAGGAGIRLPGDGRASDDPHRAWAAQAQAVQAVLDDPAAAQSTFHSEAMGDMPVAAAIDRFYTTDVFMHSWDLARATGQQHEMDAGYSRQLLDTLRPMEHMMRPSDQFGPAVPVPDDASPQDQLMGFIGRDPHWRPHPPSDR